MTEMKQYLAVEDFGDKGFYRTVFSSSNLEDAIEYAENYLNAEFCGEITDSYSGHMKNVASK